MIKDNAIVLLSGPNLNLLGVREPAIYGTDTLDTHVSNANEAAKRLGYVVHHIQSNHEGDLIKAIHDERSSALGFIANLGALSHYSWSIHDALASFDGPIVELHLSNPASREPFRHRSVLAPIANGLIAGFGGLGYELAVEALVRLISNRINPDES